MLKEPPFIYKYMITDSSLFYVMADHTSLLYHAVHNVFTSPGSRDGPGAFVINLFTNYSEYPT